jgi:hypothetical protein
VTRDEAWYLQFIRLKIDFEGRLESASALSDGMAEPILKRIHQDYLSYTALVEDESRYVRTNKKYPQAKYKEGKETLIDAMLSGFERLRVNQQHTTSAKLADLAAMADQAREMSMVIAVSCLLRDCAHVALSDPQYYSSHCALEAQDRGDRQGQFRQRRSGQVATGDRRAG